MAKEYVEIAGIKWATMNVGAEKETDSGLYFQWGDSQGYAADELGTGEDEKIFDWKHYKYCKEVTFPVSTDITKYNSTDGKTVIEESDDAVTANWGDDWRMPTKDEFHKLFFATTNKLIRNYKCSGVNGILFTDKTDRSKVLFFPLCGYCLFGSVYNVGFGNYWSSSLNSNFVLSAHDLYFSRRYVDFDNICPRRYGFPVRGVMK